MPRSVRSPGVVILHTAAPPEALTVSVFTAHSGDHEKVGVIPVPTAISTGAEHSGGGSRIEQPDHARMSPATIVGQHFVMVE